MAKILVEKSGPLNGTIKINGAKNAVLPILAATLLASDTCTLEEIPSLRDVSVMGELLTALGAKVTPLKEGVMTIDPSGEIFSEAPYELIQKMRASFCDGAITC